jgi:hypothetical protein
MFLRSSGMHPLPEPVRGGTLETLRGLINLPQDSDHAWALIKAWLVAALTPRGPYPLLALPGEQGTAKSTQAKLLQALIDPATSELRSAPRELRDLSIAAQGCWLLGFDNISHIQPWLSDALCRWATGGGWATRELYTDLDEVLFEARRPVLLNGITNYIRAPDLLDRTIQIELPPIPKGKRRPERRGHPDDLPGVLDEFEEYRPRVLGALVDLVAEALQGLPGVYLANLPRMADFAMLGLAAEKATSRRPWSLNTSIFLQAYDHSITEAHEHAIEGSPIGPALLAVMETGAWSGSHTELLEQLQIQGGDRVSRGKSWPKTPRGLSGEISRLPPALRARGYEVDTGARDPNTRRSLVTIQRQIISPRAEETPAPPSACSDTTLPPNDEDGCLDDQLHPSSEVCPTSFIISAAEDRLTILDDLGNDSSSDLPDKTTKMVSSQEDSENRMMIPTHYRDIVPLPRMIRRKGNLARPPLSPPKARIRLPRKLVTLEAPGIRRALRAPNA